MDNLFLAYTLIVVGLLLMAAELFLPTGGIVFVVGVGGLIAGVAIAFNRSTSQGIVTVIVSPASACDVISRRMGTKSTGAISTVCSRV